MNLTAELLRKMRDPRISLPQCGMVLDLQTKAYIPYDPTHITHNMQVDLLSYWANPPKDEDGYSLFMNSLKGRQSGNSFAVEACAYVTTGFTPGHDHSCLADTRDRADYLHNRIHSLDRRWPEELRPDRLNMRERLQMTFEPLTGGTMRTQSLHMGNVGIGQNPGSVHWSEVPFAEDQAAQWSAMLPSLMPQYNVRVVCESTPNPDDTEGFWQDHYLSGVHRDGRLFSKFYPYWDSKANVRTWKEDWGEGMTEEQRLMDKYGPLGLSWDNLAFRRHVIANDRRIRLNPEEFGIWYPFDDLTCWAKSAGGIIGHHLLERHVKADLIPWQPVSMTYPGDNGRIGPNPNATYVLGIDPCGYAARDHGAAQLLEVWDDLWLQVGAFSGGKHDNVGPEELARWAYDTGKRYNWATIWVESNGVGQLVIGLLKEWGYPNIAHESWGKPGIAATTKSVDKALTYLQTALLDTLVLRDADTVAQLQTYKNDKQVQDGIKAEQLRGDVGKRRRQRHHWDKVSALQWAVWGARKAPSRIRVQPEDPNLKPWIAPETATITRDFAKKKWTEIQNRLHPSRRPDHWKMGGKWH